MAHPGNNPFFPQTGYPSGSALYQMSVGSYSNTGFPPVRVFEICFVSPPAQQYFSGNFANTMATTAADSDMANESVLPDRHTASSGSVSLLRFDCHFCRIPMIQ
jgi:hypothetical protein